MYCLVNLFRCDTSDDDTSSASVLAFDEANQGLLAVASSNGGVSLYDCSSKKIFSVLSLDTSASGRILPSAEFPIRKDASCIVTSLAWMPGEPYLAMGMDNGHVSLWSAAPSSPPRLLSPKVIHTKCLHLNSIAHSNSVACLKWDRYGTGFVTGDKTGLVILWEVDDDGTLTSKLWLKKESEITDIVWFNKEVCVLKSS